MPPCVPELNGAGKATLSSLKLGKYSSVSAKSIKHLHPCISNPYHFDIYLAFIPLPNLSWTDAVVQCYSAKGSS
jgi:hypothetical protein